MLVRKIAREDHVDDVVVFQFSLGQKFLIQKAKDEEVTELAHTSRGLHARRRPQGLRWPLSGAPDPEVPGRDRQSRIGDVREKRIPSLSLSCVISTRRTTCEISALRHWL